MESYSGIVETSRDAIILLEAARVGLIPTVTRRLKDKERKLIKEGDVFIWGEKEAKMRRWTDGRSWSASRVTGSFLTYREMEYHFRDDTFNAEGKFNLSDFRHRPEGLIKQSFSLTRKDGVKMHLISYTTNQGFANAKLLNKTPSKDASLAHINIPKDLYQITSQSLETMDDIMPSKTASVSVSPKLATCTLSSPPPNFAASPKNDLTYKISSSTTSFTSSKDSYPRMILTESPIFSNFTISKKLTEVQLPPLLHGFADFPNNSNHRSKSISSYDATTLSALDRMTLKF